MLAELRQAIPGDRYGDWLTTLGQWYAPEVRFGEAFARLMVHILGDRCPLIVDAMLPGLKSAQRALDAAHRRAAVRPDEGLREPRPSDHRQGLPLAGKATTRDQSIVSRARRATPKDRMAGTHGFRLRGDEEFKGEVEGLLEILAEDPQRVSPGVRARSAIQDAVFGTCLQILGPGELSYLPQTAPLYGLLEISAPSVALRPQILVLDERQRLNVKGSGIGIERLLDPAFDLDAWLAPPEDTDFVVSAEDRLEALIESLREPSLAIDGNLERPWQKTGDQMRRALQAYGTRVTAAASRRDETARARMEALRSNCLPTGKFQERMSLRRTFPASMETVLSKPCFNRCGSSRQTCTSSRRRKRRVIESRQERRS